MMPPALRVPVIVVAEVFTIAFFVLLAWTGYQVMMILEGSSLVSLPSVSQQLTQSVIPIASVLFIVAELLRFPETLACARGDGFVHEPDLEEEMPESAEAIADNSATARREATGGR
jgi:TRAP-type C4-dicarboxylate transport system permease small subunit